MLYVFDIKIMMQKIIFYSLGAFVICSKYQIKLSLTKKILLNQGGISCE